MDKIKELPEDGTGVTATAGVRRPDSGQDQAEVEQYKSAREPEHQGLTVRGGKDRADTDESVSDWSGSMHGGLLS